MNASSEGATTKAVSYRRRGEVAIVTIDRPEALNAISSAVKEMIIGAIERAQSDEHVRVIVIRGAGDRAFSAGADIRELHPPRSVVGARQERQSEQFTDVVAASTKPTIAQVHGYCLGGGFELALACDVRIASSDAIFGLPEVTIGLIPGAGGTQRLPRLIGASRALWMIMSGERIDAGAALQFGLVAKVVDRHDLSAEVQAVADRLAANAPRAVAYAREATLRGLDRTLVDGLRLERDLATFLSTTADRAEGVAAFKERRPPSYRGE